MSAHPSRPQEYLPLTGIRLIASDLDGTLIGEDGLVPDELWPLLTELKKRGILFVPASGRQAATLQQTFESASDGMPFIGENGALVIQDGEVLHSLVISQDVVTEVVQIVRDLASDGVNIGVILSTEESAYTQRTDEAFLAQADRYYKKMTIVDDVLEFRADVVKIAICSFDDIDETLAPRVGHFKATHSVVSSVKNWIDITESGADKGKALRRLQVHLGISRAETVVFGDYLNDLELMEAADISFAVANAHPAIIATASFVAPSCDDRGVIQVIKHILADA
ncbi:MAG: HAD family hydrolase [Ancrocorticia sp.]